MLGVSGMPVSDAVGKLGDLGDCLGDKIRTLICLDWDPYSTFPFTDGLSCHRVSDLCAHFRLSLMTNTTVLPTALVLCF